MAWIRREDLNGQRVLDEAIVEDTFYVQIDEDPQDAVVYLEEENSKKGDRKNGLYSGAQFRE